MLVASLMCRPLRRADHHCCASVPCTTYTLFFEIIGIGSEKYGGVSRRRLETFGAQKREVMSRSGCQPWKHARSMPYSCLLCDVDMAEEVEIRRLEGIGDACETACEAAVAASSTLCSGSLAAAHATVTANKEVSSKQVSEPGAHEELVTGYAEHRGRRLLPARITARRRT